MKARIAFLKGLSRNRADVEDSKTIPEGSGSASAGAQATPKIHKPVNAGGARSVATALAEESLPSGMVDREIELMMAIRKELRESAARDVSSGWPSKQGSGSSQNTQAPPSEPATESPTAGPAQLNDLEQLEQGVQGSIRELGQGLQGSLPGGVTMPPTNDALDPPLPVLAPDDTSIKLGPGTAVAMSSSTAASERTPIRTICCDNSIGWHADFTYDAEYNKKYLAELNSLDDMQVPEEPMSAKSRSATLMRGPRGFGVTFGGKVDKSLPGPEGVVVADIDALCNHEGSAHITEEVRCSLGWQIIYLQGIDVRKMSLTEFGATLNRMINNSMVILLQPNETLRNYYMPVRHTLESPWELSFELGVGKPGQEILYGGAPNPEEAAEISSTGIYLAEVGTNAAFKDAHHKQILSANGHDLTNATLLEMKRILEETVTETPPVLKLLLIDNPTLIQTFEPPTDTHSQQIDEDIQAKPLPALDRPSISKFKSHLHNEIRRISHARSTAATATATATPSSPPPPVVGSDEFVAKIAGAKSLGEVIEYCKRATVETQEQVQFNSKQLAVPGQALESLEQFKDCDFEDITDATTAVGRPPAQELTEMVDDLTSLQSECVELVKQLEQLETIEGSSMVVPVIDSKFPEQFDGEADLMQMNQALQITGDIASNPIEFERHMQHRIAVVDRHLDAAERHLEAADFNFKPNHIVDITNNNRQEQQKQQERKEQQARKEQQEQSLMADLTKQVQEEETKNKLLQKQQQDLLAEQKQQQQLLAEKQPLADALLAALEGVEGQKGQEELPKQRAEPPATTQHLKLPLIQSPLHPVPLAKPAKQAMPDQTPADNADASKSVEPTNESPNTCTSEQVSIPTSEAAFDTESASDTDPESADGEKEEDDDSNEDATERRKRVREERENERREKGRGDTVLHVACASGQLEVTKLLIQQTCDINMHSDSDGNTPLMRCCEGGQYGRINFNAEKKYLECAGQLVDAGCDLNVMNFSGQTALHVAFQYRETAIADFLIRAGAKPCRTKCQKCALNIKIRSRAGVRQAKQQKKTSPSKQTVKDKVEESARVFEEEFGEFGGYRRDSAQKYMQPLFGVQHKHTLTDLSYFARKVVCALRQQALTECHVGWSAQVILTS